MRVEIVFALPDRQVLKAVEVPGGATVEDVVARSMLGRDFPDANFEHLQVGVWGKPVARDHVVAEGDRVELYRPLEMDPKDARRLKVGI